MKTEPSYISFNRGFTKSFADSTLYIEVVNNEPVTILLYVDDLLLTGVEGRIEECKKQLAAEFDMKDSR